jgi:uncharacterized membrane protein
MTKTLNVLGILALAAFILGMIPSIGGLFSIVGLILTTVLYAKIDKLGYDTHLLKFTLYQWLVALIPLSVVLVLGWKFAESKDNSSLTYIMMALCEGLLLFLAVINYFVAKSLLLIGDEANNQWFKISGILTKVGAYTMPISLGLLFVMLAQPFFLLGCIVYKPNSSTAIN